MNASDEAKAYEGWAILELMGHRRLGGRVCQVEQYGTVMIRVDVPDGEGWSTQFYGGGSIYCLTPTTEAIARAVAARNKPEPVHAWELPAPKENPGMVLGVDDEGVDDEDPETIFEKF